MTERFVDIKKSTVTFEVKSRPPTQPPLRRKVDTSSGVGQAVSKYLRNKHGGSRCGTNPVWEVADAAGNFPLDVMAAARAAYLAGEDDEDEDERS